MTEPSGHHQCPTIHNRRALAEQFDELLATGADTATDFAAAEAAWQSALAASGDTSAARAQLDHRSADLRKATRKIEHVTARLSEADDEKPAPANYDGADIAAAQLRHEAEQAQILADDTRPEEPDIEVHRAELEGDEVLADLIDDLDATTPDSYPGDDSAYWRDEDLADHDDQTMVDQSADGRTHRHPVEEPPGKTEAADAVQRAQGNHRPAGAGLRMGGHQPSRRGTRR